MDILLVGGAGGLGSVVSLYLAKRGFRVFSCDVSKFESTHKNIVALQTDIRYQDSIDKTFEAVSKMSDGLYVYPLQECM